MAHIFTMLVYLIYYYGAIIFCNVLACKSMLLAISVWSVLPSPRMSCFALSIACFPLRFARVRIRYCSS